MTVYIHFYYCCLFIWKALCHLLRIILAREKLFSLNSDMKFANVNFVWRIFS